MTSKSEEQNTTFIHQLRLLGKKLHNLVNRSKRLTRRQRCDGFICQSCKEPLVALIS